MTQRNSCFLRVGIMTHIHTHTLSSLPFSGTRPPIACPSSHALLLLLLLFTSPPPTHAYVGMRAIDLRPREYSWPIAVAHYTRQPIGSLSCAQKSVSRAYVHARTGMLRAKYCPLIAYTRRHRPPNCTTNSLSFTQSWVRIIATHTHGYKNTPLSGLGRLRLKYCPKLPHQTTTTSSSVLAPVCPSSWPWATPPTSLTTSPITFYKITMSTRSVAPLVCIMTIWKCFLHIWIWHHDLNHRLNTLTFYLYNAIPILSSLVNQKRSIVANSSRDTVTVGHI